MTKCAWCPVLFNPHPRLSFRQKTCGGGSCRRKQNLFGQKLWKGKNGDVYREGQRDWHKNHPGYWKDYRRKNSGYTKRNRMQSRIRRRLLRLSLQKKLDILEVTENTLQYWELSWFAKQTRSLVPLLWAYTGSHGNLESHSS